MAILINSDSPMRGSVGNYTYAKYNGKIVVRQKVVKKKVPCRSEAQMQLRMRWGNMVAMWHRFEDGFKPYFEDKKQRASDFNAFISANMSSQPIFMTKEAMREGGCVVGGYQICRGSLPSVSVQVKEGKCVSDILLGELVVDERTTVGEFSRAVIENNVDFEEYDLLFHLVALQSVDAQGVPRLRVVSSRLVLDVVDETPLSMVIRMNGFSNEGGYLGMAQRVDGAVAYVHGRRTKTKALISTQRLVVTCERAAEYSGEAAFERAATSYGGINKQPPSLTPKVEREPQWTDVEDDMFVLRNRVLDYFDLGLPPPAE